MPGKMRAQRQRGPRQRRRRQRAKEASSFLGVASPHEQREDGEGADDDDLGHAVHQRHAGRLAALVGGEGRERDRQAQPGVLVATLDAHRHLAPRGRAAVGPEVAVAAAAVAAAAVVCGAGGWHWRSA